MADLKPSGELEKANIHASVRNYGPDTAFDFDQEPWFRWVAETTAEREGISVDAAKEAIKRNAAPGAVGNAEWTRPQDENVSLSKTVDDD